MYTPLLAIKVLIFATVKSFRIMTISQGRPAAKMIQRVGRGVYTLGHLKMCLLEKKLYCNGLKR